MTDRQRKVLVDAFLLLAAGARTGRRKAETETAENVRAHIVEMQGMLGEVRKSLDEHIGAAHVLSKVPASALPALHAGRRAKPLSASRPR